MTVTLATAGLAMQHAGAATITQCGPNICYQYDNAQPAAAVAFFGQPTLVGDSMRFTPTQFFAQSTNGVGAHAPFGNTDFYTATFNFDRVYTVSGRPIVTVTAFDTGDYNIVGGDYVEAGLRLQGASNINGSLFPPAVDAPPVFSATLPAPAGTPWALTGVISPSAFFVSQGGAASDSRDIAVQIQNNLTAITNANRELAFIQKKFTLQVTRELVPLPAAAWMFGSALGLLGVVRRRFPAA